MVKFDEIDYFKLFQLILKKWYVILLCALLGGCVAFGYSNYFIKPTYQSKALMYVNNSISLSSRTISVSSGDLSTSARIIDTYNVILKTRNTLETVAKKAGLNYSYEKLNSMVSSTSVNNTEVFQIVVTSTDPEEACLIANTITEVFPDKVANIIGGSSAKVVDYAVVNANKVAPDVKRYTTIGAAIGAAVACLIIFLLFVMDDVIRNEEYLSSNFDVPVLAVIPNLQLDKKNTKKYRSKDSSKYYYEEKATNGVSKSESIQAQLADRLHFDAKEAYKLLRTNLQFTLPTSNKCKIIAVSSSVRSEGKSTTSINLAHTLAQGNNKVLLIDCDMRLPTIANKLNIKNPVGLSDFIIGNATGKDIIVHYKDSEYFHIITSGSIPPNPSELLGSAGMKDAIEKLEQFYDYIILDLPPVNIVSDALVTRDYIDGLIVCVRENYSDKRSLSECLRSLELIDANLLGFVLTDAKGGKSYYATGKKYNSKYRYKKYTYKYGYGYDRYGYGYGYERQKPLVKEEKNV